MDFGSFFEREGRGRKLYPVIHTVAETQALENAEVAFSAGADGVFLINHDLPWPKLVMIYETMRRRYPTAFIGLNFLDLNAQAAFHLAGKVLPDASALWVDKPDIGGQEAAAEAEELRSLMCASSWRGYYFPSVAFKYQRPEEDPGGAARIAAQYGHVTVTSGSETGTAPDLYKIKKMYESGGGHPLAVASGITVENVRSFLPYVHVFMAATGISTNETTLDVEKVRELADIIHQHGM